MTRLTTTKKCPYILGQPKLFRILTHHLLCQLFKDSRDRFGIFIFIFVTLTLGR